MARHQVRSFSVEIDSSNGFVNVEIVTDLKNPYKFKLRPDVHYSTLEDIKEKLDKALTHCVENFEKAEVVIFDDRSYVTINVKDFINTRFTGNKA